METKQETQTGPRVYVASLADYNAGRLHGRWIDANQDAEEILEEVRAMLAESKEPVAEEWAIHDYEGFEGLTLSEYESFEKVAELGQAIGEHGPAYAAYAGHVGTDYATPEGFEAAFMGEWDSEKDYAYSLADDIDLFHDVPEDSPARTYFDYDAWARDLFLDGYSSVEAPGYTVYVFDDRA